MSDYSIFYKDAFLPVADWALGSHWDVFLSAFNATERVRRVFADVNADAKWWLVHREYGFSQAEIPAGGLVHSAPAAYREDEFLLDFMQNNVKGATSICVDISGFMRPHLMFLVRTLKEFGVKKFDVLYSEPERYQKQESTEFSAGDVREVRPVAGFEGLHDPVAGDDKDLLIIAAGYEHNLIRQVATSKNNARKLQLFGFPPLQADFYQENVVNAYKASEAVGVSGTPEPLFAPASDPFVTASVVGDAVSRAFRAGYRNVYLAPLASRPQALGFALYFLAECMAKPVSVIYPFASTYSRDAAQGIARIWKYQVELE